MSDFQYTRIAAALRERVTGNSYPQGRLPSERDLMAEFSVQRDTVRRALELLEDEGLVYRDATRGRFAAPAPGARALQGTILLAVRRYEFSTSLAAVQRGMAPVINDAGHGIVWFDMLSRSGEALHLPSPETLRARGVAGVALWPEMPAHLPRLRALRAAMPLVLLDRRVPGFEADFAGFDDLGGGRRITEHLLGIGHRRIGFVSAEPLAASVDARARGWAAALDGAGIEADSAWTLHQPAGIKALEADRLLAYLDCGGKPLTAVVCANDTVAALLIRALRRLGRRVPDDVAVTGFGNAEASLLEALGLTTMSQPFEEMGRTAGKMLLARIRGRAADRRDVEMPMELIVRETCGAARRQAGD
jgi:DNA-binding LacI/PurR family transcriptional regulator